MSPNNVLYVPSVSCHKFCETFFSVETMHSRDIEHTKILIYALDLPKGFLSLLFFMGHMYVKYFQISTFRDLDYFVICMRNEAVGKFIKLS